LRAAAATDVGHSACGERGHVYVVEPTGPFEDDPNVTNKKFPGNIARLREQGLDVVEDR
jgi:hypothetical protein